MYNIYKASLPREILCKLSAVMVRKGRSASRITNDRSPIIVCSTTKEYRYQVHCICRPTDCVLEVGSAHGVTCKLISGRTKDVVGIDIQKALVEESNQKFPALHFYQKDASNIRDFLKDILPHGCPKFSVVFVDIAGTIEMKTLLPILDNIERVVRPRMIVVKSLNYSKLLIQLLKGYQVKATQGAKMALECAKSEPRWPSWSQDGANMTPRWPKLRQPGPA